MCEKKKIVPVLFLWHRPLLMCLIIHKLFTWLRSHEGSSELRMMKVMMQTLWNYTQGQSYGNDPSWAEIKRRSLTANGPGASDASLIHSHTVALADQQVLHVLMLLLLTWIHLSHEGDWRGAVLGRHGSWKLLCLRGQGDKKEKITGIIKRNVCVKLYLMVYSLFQLSPGVHVSLSETFINREIPKEIHFSVDVFSFMFLWEVVLTLTGFTLKVTAV